MPQNCPFSCGENRDIIPPVNKRKPVYAIPENKGGNHGISHEELIMRSVAPMRTAKIGQVSFIKDLKLVAISFTLFMFILVPPVISCFLLTSLLYTKVAFLSILPLGFATNATMFQHCAVFRFNAQLSQLLRNSLRPGLRLRNFLRLFAT